MATPFQKEIVPATPDRLLAWTSRSEQRRHNGDRGPASMTAVSDRLGVEARLGAMRDDQLAFQRFVADMSSGLVAAEPDALEKAIEDALRDVAAALQFDEVSLWRKRPDAAAFTPLLGRPAMSGRDEVPASAIPWVRSRLEAGLVACFARVSEVVNPCDRGWFLQRGIRSAAILPLGATPAGTSALAVGSTTRECEMTASALERLRLLAGVIGQAVARRDACEALQGAHDELRTLRARIEQEPIRRDTRNVRGSRVIVSASAAIRRALLQAEQVAPTPATVLLLGETGSGKEVFAQAIHDLSPRHQRPMIKVGCGAIPSALIESELFGRERGAYTGALVRQIGRFEAAHQSTIFLDEIGELPAELQVKLLRVLQERVIERLGSNQSIKVDVRIIAATNRNLEKAVEDRSFREDLFYRLNVFPIVVPPLRDRVEDIPELAWAFIDELSRSFGKSIESISRKSLRDLQQVLVARQRT